MNILTTDPAFTIRQATVDDIPTILGFIKDLAEYEKLSHEVVATEEILEHSLFGGTRAAEVLIGYYEQRPVAFAIYFHTFSTFLGRKGLYLEDLFVQPAMRGKGFGKILISYLAKLAVERNCGRFEWSVLDWNTPAINFYRSIGAKPMDEWTVHRVSGDALKKLAGMANTNQV